MNVVKPNRSSQWQTFSVCENGTVILQKWNPRTNSYDYKSLYRPMP